ncbi:tetratricopeptide repeat protein [Acidobacteriota bacterium]
MIRKKDMVFIGLLAVILLGIYGKTLNYELIWDDRYFLKGNVLLDENRPLWDAFTYGYFGEQLGIKGFDQYYRPLLTATFMMEKKLWGIQSLSLRLTNLSLFIFSLFFLLVFLRQFSGRTYFPEIATLLFALHPLHLDNIVWIVGRGDLLMLLWAILTFLTLELSIQKKNYGFLYLSSLFFVLGILSKESCLIFLPLLIVYEVLRRKKISALYHLINASIIFVFYFVKIRLLEIENVRFVMSSTLGASLKGIGATLGFYIKSMIFPLNYKMFIAKNDVLTPVYLVFGMAAILIFLFLLYLSRKQREILFPTLLAGSFLAGHVVLVFTQIFPYQIYARYAMIAILGLCWIGAYFMCAVKEKYRFYPALILVLIFIPSIIVNSSAYKTEIHFWQKAAKFAPHDSFVHLKIAQASFENKDYLTSEIHLNTCLSLRMRRRAAALVSLLYADLEFERVRYDDLHKWLNHLEGFTQIPNFPIAIKLRMDINKKAALVHMAYGSVNAAETLLLENITRYPGYLENYTELYRLYIGYNLWEKAEDFEMEIRKHFPNFFSGRPNTRMIKEKSETLSLEQRIYFSAQYSNYSQAIELVQKKPNLKLEDRFLLAKLFYYRGDEQQGKYVIDRIFNDHSSDHRILNRIGEFYLRDLIRADEALAYFEKSLKIESTQPAIQDLTLFLTESYLKKLKPVWN